MASSLILRSGKKVDKNRKTSVPSIYAEDQGSAKNKSRRRSEHYLDISSINIGLSVSNQNVSAKDDLDAIEVLESVPLSRSLAGSKASIDGNSARQRAVEMGFDDTRKSNPNLYMVDSHDKDYIRRREGNGEEEQDDRGFGGFGFEPKTQSDKQKDPKDRRKSCCAVLVTAPSTDK